MTAEQTAVTVDDRVEAIRKHVRWSTEGALTTRPGHSWKARYADDVSFLLQLLGPTIPETHPHEGPPNLFDAAAEAAPLTSLDTGSPAHRAVDHVTSIEADADKLGRRTGMRFALARVFYNVTATGMLYGTPNDGYTDEEAARWAGITRGAPWKRCTDLRQGGWLRWTGATRETRNGAQAKVWAMTQSGIREWERLAAEAGVRPAEFGRPEETHA